MVSLSMFSCWSMAWFVMCRRMDSSTMTCARRRALCRLSSTAGDGSFEHLLKMKFMDLEARSLSTAERKSSIWGHSLLTNKTQHDV
ncbi:hypothetical protein SETIT_2G009600v2 [Setaria italica]|uniref:Secreted protein n=1 Tax=Setaria italica TaxID=4555 RepID=A0A368PTU5_SETIT|nr:hypothetical protein SETIT_2G009600v2 [Setaria italica]